MAGLLASLEDLFGTKNLYEVLNIPSTDSAGEIKKAYYAVSLKVHPDRAEGDKEAATKRFQALSQVYSILSNQDKKALYDESGEIDDESDILQQDKDWNSYWRILFKEITIKDIEDYEKVYRFSEEERADVLTAYEECEGDMDLILESVPCCNVEDDGRFQEIIDNAIKNGKVTLYEIYRKENKKKKTTRRKKAAAEAMEAKEAAKEMGLTQPGNDDALKMMIMKRNNDKAKEMDNFFDQLEAKYCKPKKQSRKVAGKKTTNK
eukprot:gene3444-3940_t